MGSFWNRKSWISTSLALWMLETCWTKAEQYHGDNVTPLHSDGILTISQISHWTEHNDRSKDWFTLYAFTAACQLWLWYHSWDEPVPTTRIHHEGHQVRYCVYWQAWDPSCSVSTVTWTSWASVHPNGYWWAPLKWGTLSPLLQTSCRQTEVILWSRRTGQCTREPAPAPWNKPLIKLHGCLLQLRPQGCQVGEVPACERSKKTHVCAHLHIYSLLNEQHVTLSLSILHSTLYDVPPNSTKLQNCYCILIKQNKCTSSGQPHEQPTWAAVSHVPI